MTCFRIWQGKIFSEKKLKTILMHQLMAPENHLVIPEPANQDVQRSLIYVMGGTQDGLKLKYKTAALLYNEGVGKRVIILSVPGFTSYDEALCRNLTNDEWSLRQLSNLGIKRDDIEFIRVQGKIFGTLSEAKMVSEIVNKRGVQRLILICSSYHGKRVWTTFLAFLRYSRVSIQIHPIYEEIGIGSILIEYIKLFIYTNILIPLELWSQRGIINESNKINLGKTTY
jgi:hypothetical protein